MTKTYISTGNTLLDQAMKGGIPGDKITVIMGDSSGSMSWGSFPRHIRNRRLNRIHRILKRI
jgi:hypothetical protein